MVEKGIPALYTPRGTSARAAYRTARYGVDSNPLMRSL